MSTDTTTVARATGATLWLTGLPSAGKTTLATALAGRLRADGRAVEVLDGDAVRAALSPELGFSRADRDTQVARIGWIAQRLATHGVVVIAAVISPFAAARDSVRAAHADQSLPFFEVHVATPVQVCAERDVKGFYARQRDGAMSGLTGVDGEYEPPATPELRLDTSGRPVDDAVDELIALLRKENLI